MDRVRGLLEENDLRLTHSSHLSDCIPLLLKHEKEKLHGELEGNFISAIFDSTTWFGEALAKNGRLKSVLFVCYYWQTS